MGTVCVEVAVGDDPRLLDALRSLDHQTRRPDRVLVAAASSTPTTLLDEAKRQFPMLSLDIARFPGGVAGARAGSVALLREDLTAFLDSDEVAPPEWLARLLAPLEAGAAAFVGGPTRPLRPPGHPIERYYALLEASIYDRLVPANVTYLPLQNTAWRTDVLKRLGFDPRIPFAEDHDLESRAARASLRGEFLPEAWVYHDKSTETSYLRWARKRYRYLVAMAMSLLKNQELGGRLRERRTPVRHPLRYVESILKPFALIDASIRWRRVSAARAEAPTPSDLPSPSGPR